MSSISDEKAIITLEVELVSTVKGLDSTTATTPNSFFEGVPGDEFLQSVKDTIRTRFR